MTVTLRLWRSQIDSTASKPFFWRSQGVYMSLLWRFVPWATPCGLNFKPTQRWAMTMATMAIIQRPLEMLRCLLGDDKASTKTLQRFPDFLQVTMDAVRSPFCVTGVLEMINHQKLRSFSLVVESFT